VVSGPKGARVALSNFGRRERATGIEPAFSAWEALQGEINTQLKNVFFQVEPEIGKIDYA